MVEEKKPDPETREDVQELTQTTGTEGASSPQQAITDPQAETANRANAIMAETPVVNEPYSYEDVSKILENPPDIILKHWEELLNIGGSLNKPGGSSHEKVEELLTDKWVQILEEAKNDPELVKMFTNTTLLVRVSFPSNYGGRGASTRTHMAEGIIKTMKSIQRYWARKSAEKT